MINMYNVVINIIAWIAIIWWIILLLFNWLIYMFYCFDNDTKYVTLIRETAIVKSEFDGCHLLPYIKCDIRKYTTISIGWFKWQFKIYYRIKTEEEDKIEVEVRRNLKQNES